MFWQLAWLQVTNLIPVCTRLRRDLLSVTFSLSLTREKKKKTYFLLITGNLREKTFHLAHLGDTDDVMMSQFLYPSQKHCFPMSGRMTSGSYQFSNPRGSSVLHSFPPQLNAVEEHTFEDPSHPPTVLRLLYLYKNLSICGFW